MANLLAGFVKGFADNQVDQIQERRKLENEEKKAKMLSDLQRETAQANFLFEENFKRSNRVDESMSTVDPDTGKITKRALDGTVLGEGSMTPAEIAAHKRKVQAEELTIAGKQQTMANDNKRLSLEEQRLQESRADRAERKAERLGLDGSGKSTTAGAAALIGAYGDTVEGLVKKGISRVDIESSTIRMMARIRANNPNATGPELLDKGRVSFMEHLSNLEAGLQPDPSPADVTKPGFIYDPAITKARALDRR